MAAEATQIRVWVETADDGGYLLPVGARLESVDDKDPKQVGGSGYTAIPGQRLVLAGVGRNDDANPTAAQVFSAVKSFVDFFTSNHDIKRVVVTRHNGEKALGGKQDTLPGTQVEEYLPAHAEPKPQRWDVMDYGIEDLVLPFHFSFRLILQNYPEGDMDFYEIGSLRELRPQVSREVSNGIASYTVAVDLKMQPYEGSANALAMVEALATGAQVSPDAFFGANPRTGQHSGLVAIIAGIVQGAKLQSVSVMFQKLESMFSMRLTAIKPTMRAGGFENVLSMRVEVLGNIDEGIRLFDVKERGAKKTVQRASNPSGTITLKIDVIDLDALIGPSGFASIVSSIRGELGRKGVIVVGRDFGRVTGDIAGDNTETRNVMSTVIRMEVTDPKTLGSTSGRTSSPAERAGAEIPEIIREALGVATLKAMLPGADTSHITEQLG